MRKTLLAVTIASALTLSACGKTEDVNSADMNASVSPELNEADALEGTVNESMTNVDGAMGASDTMVATNIAEPMNSASAAEPGNGTDNSTK